MKSANLNRFSLLEESGDQSSPLENSIPAPPTCQVEEQDTPAPTEVTGKGSIKFVLPEPEKKGRKKYKKLAAKYARRRSRGFNKGGNMETYERTLEWMEEKRAQHRTAEEAAMKARASEETSCATGSDDILSNILKTLSSDITTEINMYEPPRDTTQQRIRNKPVSIASVVREVCANLFGTRDRMREGVLNGSIPSGIADSGTTSTVGAEKDKHLFNAMNEKSNKVFSVANGNMEHATEVKQLQHDLRESARRVDIVPGIKMTLLSTGKLADADYISVFDKEGVQIYDANNTKIFL